MKLVILGPGLNQLWICMSNRSGIPYSIPSQTHISHIHSYMNIQTKYYLLRVVIKKTQQTKEMMGQRPFPNMVCTRESVSRLEFSFSKKYYILSIQY